MHDEGKDGTVKPICPSGQNGERNAVPSCRLITEKLLKGDDMVERVAMAMWGTPRLKHTSLGRRKQQMRDDTILPISAVIVGPNTLSGAPGTPGEWSPPWRDNKGNEWDSNASKVTIWFRTWDECRAFTNSLSRRDDRQKEAADAR